MSLSLRDKIEILIEADFEFGTPTAFILGPYDPEAGGSRVMFEVPTVEEDGISYDPAFTCVEEMEALVDEALSYAREKGIL